MPLFIISKIYSQTHTNFFFLYFSAFKLNKGRKFEPVRRDGRVVEGARLESVYMPKAYHGFESHSLR